MSQAEKKASVEALGWGYESKTAREGGSGGKVEGGKSREEWGLPLSDADTSNVTE